MLDEQKMSLIRRLDRLHRKEWEEEELDED